MDNSNYWYQKMGVSDYEIDETITISSHSYIIRDGILRQRDVISDRQNQTRDAFGFKWDKRNTYESESVQENGRQWLIERYLNGEPEKLRKLVKEGSNVLDAGCGSGNAAILFFGKYLNEINYLGVDISTAVDVATERFAEQGVRGEFIQSDLNGLPFSRPVFDTIFSEGVLHHTDSTETSFKGLSELLLPGGRIMFYVYRRKSPIREYSDDYVRTCLEELSDEVAWEQLKPLTKLGKALGDMKTEVDVPEDIPFLGIQKGKIDLQRLFYWHIFKAFYKPDWTVDELNHVNFDWYRPRNCHRHSPEEIQQWCEDISLEIEHMDIQEAGITVVARK